MGAGEDGIKNKDAGLSVFHGAQESDGENEHQVYDSGSFHISLDTEDWPRRFKMDTKTLKLVQKYLAVTLFPLTLNSE